MNEHAVIEVEASRAFLPPASRSTAPAQAPTPCEKRLFSQLFLCLSRACLGKMILFSLKWFTKRAFFAPPVLPDLQIPNTGHRFRIIDHERFTHTHTHTRTHGRDQRDCTLGQPLWTGADCTRQLLLLALRI
jgi:hypothetical protein